MCLSSRLMIVKSHSRRQSISLKKDVRKLPIFPCRACFRLRAAASQVTSKQWRNIKQVLKLYWNVHPTTSRIERSLENYLRKIVRMEFLQPLRNLPSTHTRFVKKYIFLFLNN